jgi:Uma2 family endonuclease
MSATTASNLSVEEFHRLYDGEKPAFEYWFGEAIQKIMPSNLHGVVQFVIMLMLRNLGWSVASEVRLKVVREAEPVPDVIAVHGKLPKHYPQTAPELCIEILSPGDRLQRTLWKAHHYLDWGTRFVWIIDPEARTAWSLVKDGENTVEQWIRPDELLNAGAGASVSLKVLFEEVDKMIE